MERPTVSRAVLQASAVVAAQWLVHAIAGQIPFPAQSAADLVIRRTPGVIATTAIDALGHLAQALLAGGASVAYAAMLAVVAHRVSRGFAPATAVATVAASLLDPHRPSIGSIATAACIGTGVAVLVAIRRETSGAEGDVTRRSVLRFGALGAGLIGAGGAAVVRKVFAGAPSEVVGASAPVELVADPSFRAVRRLASRVTSRRDHYTVDINIADPTLSNDDWRLRIGGLVAREQRYSLEDLQSMRTVEQFFTLTCISNPVGGDLIGNSRWTGVPLQDLIALAEPKPGGIYLHVTAADGYSESFPLEAVMRPDALVAFGMNGLLLSRGHGFPARLLVPNHYGVRNVKWPTDLFVTNRPKDGYWVQRGWDTQIPIRTGSRIDVPSMLEDVSLEVVVAGIAWAGNRRISKVEVSVDDGTTWTSAQLESAIAVNSWRRWQLPVRLAAGEHAIVVRATDGNGVLQSADKREPHPAGASGWHRVKVTARP